MEIISSQLGTFDQSGALESCQTCQTLFETLLSHDNRSFSMQLGFHHPIIGVGAPITQFLPSVSELLQADAIIPENQDVANAIGAITSLVRVERQMTIKPDGSGRFYIEGLKGNRRFENVKGAEKHTRQSLVDAVRRLAQKNGTGQTRVTIKSRDMLVKTSSGEEIFLGRQLVAQLKGRPDFIC